MSEKKEYIIQPRDQFGEVDPFDVDKKAFMAFVFGHLKWLSDLKKDGYTDIILTRLLMVDTIGPLARKSLHLDKWNRCQMTQTMNMSIDRLIELMDDPDNKKFPLETK